MSAKTYAQWGGIILLVLGVLGLVLKSLGPFNTDLVEDLIHLGVGLLLVYAGFRGTDAQAASWAKIFGIVFIVVGIVGFLLPKLFGLFPAGLGAADNIFHIVYGAVGFWAARTYKPAMG